MVSWHQKGNIENTNGRKDMKCSAFDNKKYCHEINLVVSMSQLTTNQISKQINYKENSRFQIFTYIYCPCKRLRPNMKVRPVANLWQFAQAASYLFSGYFYLSMVCSFCWKIIAYNKDWFYILHGFKINFGTKMSQLSHIHCWLIRLMRSVIVVKQKSSISLWIFSNLRVVEKLRKCHARGQ